MVRPVVFEHCEGSVVLCGSNASLLLFPQPDLEEIGNLEVYIKRTDTILVHCSNGYFTSKNVMARRLTALICLYFS